LNLDELLQTFSAVDQEKHKSRIPSLSYSQPNFYWIFKNADFEDWSSTTCSQVLWLSEPPECSIDRVSSYEIDVEKKKASETQKFVLYFFCSTADTKNPIVSFIHSLLYQIICCSSSNENAPIVKAFLRTLLDVILGKERAFNKKLRHFGEGDCPSAIIKNILDANTDGLWSALRAALDNEHARELSIIIDGLDKVEHQKVEFIREVRELIEYLRERTSKVKALLTSRPEARIKEALDGLPCIEYDKERKGSVTP
jgi:ankyrin repeat domain-containing protein 50